MNNIPIIPKLKAVTINSSKLFTYESKDPSYLFNETFLPEEYRIIINDKGIIIESATTKGKFYAQMTLKQLFRIYPKNIPYLEIRDSPKYSYRGYMLDSSRHFFSVEEIKKQIDIMALLKLNVFHWHLTDDQGWRIEIEKYPRLTEIGSTRRGTRGDNKIVSGYYSKQDIKEIIKYCQERFIEVIPEVDMPGHFTAACSSYPELLCTKKNIEVSESFGILPNIVCAGRDFAYKFCEEIMDEVTELFPSPYIHIGGDEALKTNWLFCPDCQNKIKEKGLKDEEELETFFINHMASYLMSKGKKVICWNDGMNGNTVKDDVIMQYWKDNDEFTLKAIDEANTGRNLIISPFTKYYLDYNYGITSLKRTYNFKPLLKGITNSTKILGVEAPLWTEYVDNLSRMEYLMYPRLIAVAEVGWSENNSDYDDFEIRLKKFNEILDGVKINYAPLRKVNPNIIKGLGLKLKFYFKAVDKSIIRSLWQVKKYNRLKRKKK
ncbi:MAG: family 20 glycosylhydrolase [Bacilli bacterium]|nr:family 20 glycosylhydrolase [Bacilli bacterium]